MKRSIARGLRRTARKLILWSNRLDGPRVAYYDRRWNRVNAPAERITFESDGIRFSGRVRNG